MSLGKDKTLACGYNIMVYIYMYVHIMVLCIFLPSILTEIFPKMTQS